MKASKLRLADKPDRQTRVLRVDEVSARLQKAYDELPKRYAIVNTKSSLVRKLIRWVKGI